MRTYALVSRERIARNYRNIRDAVGPGVEVMGVVKAEAYGHGTVEVSRVLVAEGARWLAVACVEEGVALRRAGIGARILVMGGALPFEYEALFEYNLTPTVHSLEDMAALDAAGRAVGFHLKLDSGMGRLGTRAGAAGIRRALAGLRHARLEGLMTHFASPGDFTMSQTEDQVAHFDAACAGLDCEYRHAAASGAIAWGRRAGWYNMVRVGLALYGYVSPPVGEAPASLLDVRPPLAWKARLIAVKDLPAGALVGYNGSFRAPRPMRIGVVAAGYADGVDRRLSGRGHVIAAGRLAPILGVVSMDATTIDLSQAPALAPGDEVTLLGTEGAATIDAQHIADLTGAIPYTVLCGIGARVRRVYT